MCAFEVELELVGLMEYFFRLKICKARHIILQAKKEPQYLLAREELFVVVSIVSLKGSSDIRSIRAIRQELR